MASAVRQITVREVTQAVTGVDPSVLLISPRLLQRVIRFDRRLPNFLMSAPHGKSYFLSRERLFDIVSRYELELDFDHKVLDKVILLEKPTEAGLLERPASEVLFDCWRLLFHVRVHLALEQRLEDGTLTDEDVLDRWQRLGMTAYSEIRSVLQKDDLLLPPRSDTSIYVEFAAVFLELLYFAPDLLDEHFPGLRHTDEVAALLAEDLDHQRLYAVTRVPGAAEWSELRHDDDEWSYGALPPVDVVEVDPLKPSPPAYWRLLARAEKVGSLGNVVKAAILRNKAATQALPDRVRDAESLANAELERLARRLRPVLGLNEEETQEWASALAPLLKLTNRGVRAVETRLLYDLQKVCVEHERGVYAIDLLAWVRSWGHVPLRRSLPLLRQVLVTKHLQSAARKLTTSRLSGETRRRLWRLIQTAAERAKQRLRDRVRPRIIETLEAEGLRPQNLPERVAFGKIVEVLLDRIVEQGYLSMGHLRDTLSQNNLKLPDLTRLWDLAFGDLLLRIDRRLADRLDGVYHRGPIYLRMSQRLSSLAFGTRLGRVLTRNVALPYGGAYLILESFRHIFHLFVASESEAPPEVGVAAFPSSVVPRPPAGGFRRPETLTLVIWFLIGTMLLMLIRNAEFRGWFLRGLSRFGQWCRRVLLDLPAALLRLPWVRRLLDSPVYHVSMSYLFKPLVVTACVLLPYERRAGEGTWASRATLFLSINLLLNSPLGRYADMLITEQLARGWRELQMRVFGAMYRFVVDSFQFILRAMEQLLYTVDEWLRFRTGEQRWVLAVKAPLSVVWSLITSVVRFCITLLIEPQVNPIKHFPVVTVSHKLLIAAGPIFVSQLTPYLGAARANTMVWSTIWLIPGVFGFLAWELKENWRLYAANRPAQLQPIRIGSHNENMARLLRLGFHSGTVPRLFGRLRQAVRKAARTHNLRAVHKHRANLHQIQEYVHRMMDREFLALLAESPAWHGIALRVDSVQVAVHQFSIRLAHGDPAFDPLRITFEERGGWLLGSLTDDAWLEAQPESRRQSFRFALRGLFKYAGVDLVWESLLAQLGTPCWWSDMNSDGLLIWPRARDLSTVLFKLRDTGVAATLEPPPGEIIEVPAEQARRFVFARQPLSWQEWVDTWERSPEPASPTTVSAGLST